MLRLSRRPRSQAQAAAAPHLLLSGSAAEGVAPVARREPWRSWAPTWCWRGRALELFAHTPARCHGGRAEELPDPACWRGGRDPLPFPSAAASRLPSLIMRPAALSSPPAAWLHPLLSAGPSDVGASDPTSPGSSGASCRRPLHELRLSPQTRVVAPGCSCGRCCDPLGLGLLPFFWLNHQLPGRGNQPSAAFLPPVPLPGP